ncbi:MAG TPA: hypothetical protein VMV70_00880, partial [Gallionella sp.]|nr:hypothetical protein [Gallionella sp.]
FFVVLPVANSRSKRQISHKVTKAALNLSNSFIIASPVWQLELIVNEAQRVGIDNWNDTQSIE